MATLQEQLTRSYNSFSGVDIQATFAGKIIGTLQGVSYTVTREKAPIYTMGSANPRAFSRGKRGIAGSLIFVVIDRSNLVEALGDYAKFWASIEDRTWMNQTRSAGVGSGAQTPASLYGEQAVGVAGIGETVQSYAWYHDQIPPFNIVLTALNEYGATSRMMVVGVEILNAGSGISIDDITTDENMTFVARDVVPWRSLGVSPISTTEQTVF